MSEIENTETKHTEQKDTNTELEQLQETVNFWVDNMRLNDWDITVDVLDNGDFVLKASLPEAEGENSIDGPRKVSEIILKCDSTIDHEYAIVHELAHLITNAYATMWDNWAAFFPPVNSTVIDKQFYDCNETAVNHFTKAMLSVRDISYQLGYKAAKEELMLKKEK